MKSLYDFSRSAETYDDYYKSNFGKKVDTLEKRCVHEHLKLTGDISDILEIGAGTGHWSEWLADNGYKVHGIDISEKMLEKAISKNIKNAVFEIMDAHNLDIDDNSVKNVITVSSLEFCFDLNKVIREISRVLEVGGYLTVATLNSDSIIGETKASNKTFSEANFLNKSKLIDALKEFELIKYSETVFLNSNFDLVDSQEEGKAGMLIITVKK